MMGFLIGALTLLAVVLFGLLRPLLRRQRLRLASRDDVLGVLREQKQELDGELHAGLISKAAYTQSVAELEQRVIQEAMGDKEIAPVARWARLWALVLGVLLPVAAGGVYALLGNPAGLHPEQFSAAGMKPEQIEAMVATAAARIKAHPEDVEGAQMLARSYMVLERYGEAAQVYAGLAKRLPNDAQIYADWADAAAGAQQGKFAGEPEQLVAKALQLDRHNVKALALAGTVAFDRGDYAVAAKLWQGALAEVEPGSEFAQSLKSMVDEAQKMAGKPSAQSGVPAHAKAAAEPAASVALTLQGKVSLAAALAGEASADDAVFVFARPAEGGPPVAGMRYKVRDLPIQFDFSKAMLMGSGSVAPEVKLIVGARISKSGNAMPAAGDLQGFSPEVAPGAKGVVVEINARYVAK